MKSGAETRKLRRKTQAIDIPPYNATTFWLNGFDVFQRITFKLETDNLNKEQATFFESRLWTCFLSFV